MRAQQSASWSNLRSRYLSARAPFQALDSLTVALPLIAIGDSASGTPLDPAFFSVFNNFLRLDTAALRQAWPDCHSLRVVYRVLPMALHTVVRRLDTLSIRRKNPNSQAIEFDYTPYQPDKQPWEISGINSSGAYTRGLSFGNSQNLVFNSNLNLQLDGQLGNDLELRAALSDNSIPLQPDGTTRQLQEFDRIFIQLKRKNAALSAGDFDLKRPDGYFSNYFKRLQGAMVEYTTPPSQPPAPSLSGGGGLGAGVRVAAAISRGKFARQIVQGQEGNQGPYRLQGAEGERFIIVLAGTEKVFLDGQLLRRGLDADYTVDYNLGEVAFTARRLITKDSRITLEFEYAVQTYLRSTLAASTHLQQRHGKVYFNLYSEQDSRGNGSAGDLSPAERQVLANTGDNLRSALASGIDTLEEFDPSRVLYRIVDSVVCGANYPILRYSTDPDSARYAARFSEVTAGQGNYVLAQTAANGRVFRWVAPDPLSCQPRGNYEPIVRLTPPEQRQLYTLGADYQVFKSGKIQAEAALSNRDANRYSPKDDGDNLGGAIFLSLRQNLWGLKKAAATAPTAAKAATEGTLYANYEQTTRQFQALNPYRSAEFARDWNTLGSLDTAAEQLAKAGLVFKSSALGTAQYEFGGFRRAGVYEGMRHSGQLRVQRAGWDFLGDMNILQTAGRLENTRFSRPKFDFSKTFYRKNALRDSTARAAFFKVGIYAEREKNARRAVAIDTLGGLSFWYDLARVYVQMPDHGGAWQWSAYAGQRNDYAPTSGGFRQNTVAHELNFNGSWSNARIPNRPKNGGTQQVNWLLTWRELRILVPELSGEKPQDTYLGRVDYALTALKNAVNLTTGYEVGSGQSPKLEFNYLIVNPGEGQYTWVDRNRDSILQVDEMETAVFLDQANYVRVAVTTPEYIRTNNVLLSQNLRLEPRLLWPGARRGWKAVLGRLATQSNWQINRRTFADARGISPWNPLELDVADTALVTVNASVRNILFINRARPEWDASLSQGDMRSQLTLTTGFEQRRNEDYTAHGRLNFGPRWSAETDFSRLRKTSDNQAFNNRDFNIAIWQALPKVSWLPSRHFRAAVFLKWKKSANALGEQETAEQTDLNAELTWNPPGKSTGQGFRAATSLRLKVTKADIRYTGQPNTAVAFTMLEGLQNGQNYLWSLQLDRQLSKSLQLNIQYEGRRTGGNRTVHVGRAQVRALF